MLLTDTGAQGAFPRRPKIVPVNDHVWLLNDNNEATGYVVAGTRRAVVIDTMTGFADVRTEAERLTALPLLCVNTHGHLDHIGGNWGFSEAYLHPADLSLAEESLSSPEVQAVAKPLGLRFARFLPLSDGQVFDLGSLSLEVIHIPGHTAGSIALLDREDRILFSGDGVIEQLWMQLPESLPIETQVQSLERLTALRPQFDVVLSGHSRAPHGAELLDALLSAAKDVAAGNTAGDYDYAWFGGTCRAHPYGPGPRRICF